MKLWLTPGGRVVLSGLFFAFLVLGVTGVQPVRGVWGAAAVDPQYDASAALRTSQDAIGTALSDLTLRNGGGQPLKLSSFQGKPLLINLIYTSCFHACPLVVQTLDAALDDAENTFGVGAFNVVSIGFDTNVDTPERMRRFAAAQGIDRANWQFLSASRETMDTLVEEIGFIFYPSTKGFDHLAQTTIIDSDGVVYYQVYGSEFDSPRLVEPLKDLIFGRAGNYTSVDGLVNRLLLFCTIYDTSSGRYRFDYSLIIGATIGFLSLMGIAVFLVRSWRRLPQDRA